MKKGIANTLENTNMPASGQRQLPAVVITRSVPTNGAVQVKEVKVKVKPISSAPMTWLPA